MKRTTLALLTGLLLLPTAASAQSGADPTGAVDRDARTRADSAAAEGAEIFLGAFRAIRNYHLEAFGDSILWRKALEGLIQELDDPYATVFTPDEYSEFQEDNTGDYAGIGVTISRLNDLVTITAVFRGTPADHVGLQVGDRIVGVNGNDATDWSIDQASSRIRGRPGTTVDVEIARPGLVGPIPFTIRRDNVHVPAVTAERITEDVGYIQIDRVARSSAQEVDSSIVELDGARGLILDLRRNPGGYLDEALELSDLFLERGQTLASARSRVPGSGGETREERWQARSPARIPDLPIVVLVDQYTASAAEILAGALQDHDRALVMGERTFGKGVVQTLMRLPGNRRIRLTTGSWFTPLGRSLHRPRDREGRPVAERPDTFPTVVTGGGRELKAGGGVFPDLPVVADTLTSEEQAFLQSAASARIPLGLRMAEFSFEQTQNGRTGDGEEDAPVMDSRAFEAFLDALVEEGLPPEALTPEAREYLAWRARTQIADRSEDTDRALRIRMERDRVLARAVALLEDARTQADLFAAARSDAEARAAAGRPGS